MNQPRLGYFDSFERLKSTYWLTSGRLSGDYQKDSASHDAMFFRVVMTCQLHDRSTMCESAVEVAW